MSHPVQPRDFAAPLPWRTFYVRLYGFEGEGATYKELKSARAIHSLSDQELAWVCRTLWAEIEHRVLRATEGA